MAYQNSPNISNETQKQPNNFYPHDMEELPFVNTMQVNERNWDSGIFDCISCDRPWICFLACVCPCLVFGEIYDGLKDNIPAETKTTGARCNSAACLYCLLDYPFSIGCALIFTYALGISVPALPSFSFCIHHEVRTSIREKDSQNPISGTSCEDISFTFCLPCCLLIQEHKQVFPLRSDD